MTRERLRLLGAVALFSLSSESIFVAYGEWLETTVGLSVAAIGLFTAAGALASSALFVAGGVALSGLATAGGSLGAVVLLSGVHDDRDRWRQAS
jgi:hypothetical protein